jgi:hypothetical protein
MLAITRSRPLANTRFRRAIHVIRTCLAGGCSVAASSRRAPRPTGVIAARNARRERLIASRLTVVHENGARTMAHYVYFATEIPSGLMIEIAESLPPNVRAFVRWCGAGGERVERRRPDT